MYIDPQQVIGKALAVLQDYHNIILHCNTLQHTATHCNTLQHTNWPGTRSAARLPQHYITLQHTATHCNTLQHTATHCNTQISQALAELQDYHNPLHIPCIYTYMFLIDINIYVPSIHFCCLTTPTNVHSFAAETLCTLDAQVVTNRIHNRYWARRSQYSPTTTTSIYLPRKFAYPPAL